VNDGAGNVTVLRLPVPYETESPTGPGGRVATSRGDTRVRQLSSSTPVSSAGGWVPSPGLERPAAEAFQELYEASYGDVVAMLYALTGGLTDAHDLAQEAFCRAWQHWRTVESRDAPVAWVKRVAANLAISQARRRLVARRYLARQRPEHVPAVSADHVGLSDALRQLPVQQSRVLVLHYMADMPVAGIAELLGVREGTVKSWLFRGRHALADLLREPASPEGDRKS
jgi:RNA polymerase sigma-70 factor (ECF subfamily)